MMIDLRKNAEDLLKECFPDQSLSQKIVHGAWKSLYESYSEVVGKSDNFQFTDGADKPQAVVASKKYPPLSFCFDK